MYDTINSWLDFSHCQNVNHLAIKKSLTNFTEHKSEKGYYYSGNLKNLNITSNSSGLSVKGSLAKYFLNDNFQTLTRSDSARAVEQLSESLLLPMDKSKLTRIDFAQNHIMKYKPEAYFNHLGESNNYMRQPVTKSLYYSGTNKQKLFYNKVAEGLKRGIDIPEVWKGSNILRFEMRYKGRLARRFNRPEVNLSTLSNEAFYIQIFNDWYNEYQNIDKLKKFNLNHMLMNSPKDFWKQMQLLTIKSIGEENIIQEIEAMRSKGIFSKPEYYSRLKKEVKTLCNEPCLTSTPELIEELDHKMTACKRYFR